MSLDSEFLPYVPEDFVEFWTEVQQEAARIPLYFKRESIIVDSAHGHRVEKIEFRGAQDRLVEGWIAFPAELVEFRVSFGSHRMVENLSCRMNMALAQICAQCRSIFITNKRFIKKNIKLVGGIFRAERKAEKPGFFDE